MKRFILLLVSEFLLSHFSSMAQTEFLKATYITDLDNSSYSRNFTIHNDLVYFCARSISHQGIWVTDGTPEGTREVLPIDGVTNLSVINDHILFFSHHYASNKLILYKLTSDYKMEELVSMKNSVINYSSDPVIMDGKMFIRIYSNDNGNELWVTDGTKEGTNLLGNIYPGFTNDGIQQMFKINDEYFFKAFDSNDYYLWVTDGTRENTRKANWFPFDTYGIKRLAENGGELICSVKNNDKIEFWRTNGSSEDTKFLTSGKYLSTNHDFVFLQNSLIFPVGYDNFFKRGNVLRFDFSTNELDTLFSPEPDEFFDIIKLDSFKDRVILVLSNGYTSNASILIGNANNSYFDLLADNLYYYNYASFEYNNYKYMKIGSETYILDGNDFGLDRVLGIQWPVNNRFTIYNDKIVYQGSDYNIHGELFSADLNFRNSKLIKNINTEKTSSQIKNLVATDDHLFFSGRSEREGIELWATQGNPESTVLIKDISPGEDYYSDNSNPSYMINYHGQLFFSASDGTNNVNSNGVLLGHNLWKSNGTLSGTQKVKNVGMEFTQNAQNHLKNKIIFEDRIFFGASEKSSGYELWVSEGEEENTSMFKNIVEDDPNLFYGWSSFPGDFICAGDKFFFTAVTPNHGRELYVSDGTINGTKMVMDILPGNEGSMEKGIYIYYGVNSRYMSEEYNNMTNYGDGVIFTPKTNEYGIELWISMGTPESTHLIKDINPGSESSSPLYFHNYQDKIIFTAYNESSGIELWLTDGTEEGTYMIKDINPGNSNGIHYTLNGISYKDHFYFAGISEDHGVELWRTDGTSEGTELYMDIYKGESSSNPNSFIVYNDLLFFFAQDFYDSHSLWYSDGSKVLGSKAYEFDTETVYRPNNITLFKDKFYFTGIHPEHGQGLYSYNYLEDPTLGIWDNELPKSVNIFPVPTSTELMLKIDKNSDFGQDATIFDISGRKIAGIKIEKIDTELYLVDLPDYLKSGFYILKLSINDGIVSQRFLKK